LPKIAVVADDLTGAVETAATFLSRELRIRIILDLGTTSHLGTADVQAFDTDGRQRNEFDAAERVAAVFAAIPRGAVVFKKIDSLLRGHLCPELLAARNSRTNLVVAPALPSAGRTVRDGVVHVDGQPLHQSGLWHAEGRAAPDTLIDALSPLATTVVPLSVVRSDGLGSAVRTSLRDGRVPLCDSDDDADLDRVIAAVAGIPDLVLVGSAGLAAALARTLPIAGDPASQGPGTSTADRVLAVIGSAARSIRNQLDAIAQLNPEVISVRPADLIDPSGAGIAIVTKAVANSTSAVVVVVVDSGATIEPGRSRAVAAELSRAVASGASQFGGLMLTGGETARRVLDRMGVSELEPLFAVHHGAVVCASPNGQLIATRPGSFGDQNSLLSIIRALQAGHPLTKESA
jgi:uncharacterized protein YgbK (DUF1537 family)